MKTISEKEQFVLGWILKEKHVDILNTDFVEDYISSFSPSHKIMTYGANRCPELGQIMSSMYKRGIISRQSIGLQNGAWHPGFPKWVWSYSEKSL